MNLPTFDIKDAEEARRWNGAAVFARAETKGQEKLYFGGVSFAIDGAEGTLIRKKRGDWDFEGDYDSRAAVVLDDTV